LIKKEYILIFKSLTLNALCLFALCLGFVFSSKINAQSISVFAGNDQTVCANDTLDLSILNATITGTVTNGYWFTSGDGQFLPSQQFNRFTITDKYVPSPADRNAGFVNLILVSDDPDGVGPLVQITDQVKISFLGNLSIVCNSNLNISLGPDCTQLVTPSMLITNMQQPIGYYTVSIKNQYNQPIPNSVLTNEHIGKVLEYSVGHECGNNTCWGNINVQDKLAPTLSCTNKTILCGISTLPDSLGFPIPATAKAKKTGIKKYRVIGLDACGPATLTYNDVYVDLKCVNDLQGKITRTWSAVDSFGNSSTCTQVITIKNRTLAQVVLPPNFDGVTKPGFECNGNWPKLPNGFPSPDTTGMPTTTGCVNLEATYLDSKFDQCGAAYNVLRKWTIINWCGTLTTEFNQLIKIKDSKAPLFDCPANITLNTAAYDCSNGIDTLPYPKNVIDCSTSPLKINIEEVGSKVDYSYLVFYAMNGKSVVSNLPIGEFMASYIMIDACGNSDTCKARITVKDNVVPIAICDQVTKVPLSNTGTSRLFAATVDDGSFDNCQISTFKIAKVVDTCYNQPLLFADYVDFCCLESNKKIMAVLRVTDNFGNSNSCSVEVIIEDKILPLITCPSNLVVSCKNEIDTTKLNIFGTVANGLTNVTPIIINDFYNTGIAGYNGYYTDNCQVVVSSSYALNLTCNQGTIVRTFKAKDQNKNEATCQQTITVKDPQLFSFSNIIWPNPLVELTGCDESVALVSQTGKPSFNNVNCANVAATYNDVIFHNTDGACVKVLREWTVIDWCQFNANPTSGKWVRNQTIKINNITQPEFGLNFRDTILCMFNANCGPEKFVFTPAGSDDCTKVENLQAAWQIDLNNNGSIDFTGTSRKIEVDLPAGKHKLNYTLIDECGNENTKTIFVTSKDCKKPNPYCISQLNSVIMPNNGTLNIKAKTFDLGSSDNCTVSNKLKFSFTQDAKDSTRLITCADIQNGVSDTLELKMWVIDLEGNSEFCKVEFAIQDNGDVCQDKNLNGSIEGSIFASDLTRKVKHTKVVFKASNQDYSSVKYSGFDGKYNASGFPINMSITVKPEKNDSITEGISTLDLVLIQRHILGLTKFTDPYKLIAADADANKKISVTDLVALRKVILGASLTLPKNRNCYTFVDKNFIFLDDKNPFIYPDSIKFSNLNSEGKKADFVAIKIGDVNNSIGNVKADLDAYNRSIVKKMYYKKVENSFVFYFKENALIDGFQISFLTKHIDQDYIQFNTDLGTFDYALTNDMVKIMMYTSVSIEISQDQWLFKIKADEINPFLSNFNQFYELEEMKNLTLISDIEENDSDVMNAQNFKIELMDGTVLINSLKDQNITLKFYDAVGRVVWSRALFLTIGENRFPFGNSGLNKIYFSEAIVENKKWSGKHITN
jgi:hypothetical protein